MITTQSTVQNTTSKLRGSIHKNLYEPTFHNIPNESQDSIPSKVQFSQGSNTLLKSKGDVLNFLPDSLTKLLPEVNIKVTLLCLFWYVTSSISSNISKAILREFPHPVALTELQFLTNAALCLLFATLINYCRTQQFNFHWISNTLQNLPEGLLPTYLNGSFYDCIWSKFLAVDKTALVSTFPMGLFQFFGHVTSYKATSLIPVSLVHSVKALSPIVTVCWYRFAKGKRFNSMTYLTLIPLMSGVMLTSSARTPTKEYSKDLSDTRSTPSAADSFYIIGLFFAAISMAIFVAQNIFSKSILTVKKKELLPSQKKTSNHVSVAASYNLDKITILFYCSCIGFLLTLPIVIITELLPSRSVFADFTYRTLFLFLIYGFTHFTQAMLAFQLIGRLSPVTYSIANIMKRIVVIGVALTWESHFSTRQILGLIMTVIGLYGYDKWGNKVSNHSH
ncbi:HDL513Wp [Eremothecium sinecaudum]|uniref:HDL513Wp n=1 Tax=Eremothecium sinecaudum TaxID=45286 RepID=A0A0X8HQQ7_9SACH|nr:HDL513Wp [Eremothecium sinecaudum]AMD20231.1 HDL513Wp [Eremothecium sinecaudum]